MNSPTPKDPATIEITVQGIAQLHARHHETASLLRRVIEHTTALIARPRFAGVLTVIATGWIGFNLLLMALNRHPLDPPPFIALASAASLLSLYVAILILATQRREYQLARSREQLTLELALLGEQKTTKVIQLLEEARRDNPFLRDRVDHQAEAMARSSDTDSARNAIKETQAEAARIHGKLSPSD